MPIARAIRAWHADHPRDRPARRQNPKLDQEHDRTSDMAAVLDNRPLTSASECEGLFQADLNADDGSWVRDGNPPRVLWY
jgi:hypothetical protein